MKKIYVYIISFTIIFLGCCAAFMLSTQKNKKAYVDYADEQFNKYQYYSYIESIEESGLNVDSVEFESYDDTFTYYNSEEKVISYECIVKNIYSSNIDAWYTKEYVDAGKENFAKKFGKLLYKLSEEYSYEIDSGWHVTVNIRLQNDVSKCSIISSETGKEYIFERTDDMITTTIIESFEIPKESTGKQLMSLPGLGEASKAEYCKDYYKLDMDHRSITYKWYDSTGSLIYIVTVDGNGRITSKTDYR